MAQNESYQAAIKEAASAAWDQDWTRAIEAYQHALQAVPQDTQAMAGLALALLEARRYQDALSTYQRVNELVPNDPLPHEKMAEIYEVTGEHGEAAKHYLAAGEVYFSRKDRQRAILNWEEALRFDIDIAKAHMRLAVAYEQEESTRSKAVFEYIHVARMLQNLNQNQRAEQALQRALSHDSISPDVRNALDDLRRNTPIHTDWVPFEAERPVRGTGTLVADDIDESNDYLDVAEMAEDSRTPIEESARHSMGMLADIIWTGEVPPEAQTPLLQAIDAHQVGDVDNAVAFYRAALERGLDHPALRFNLGVLYQYAHKFDDAIEMLSQSHYQEEYSLASHLMLGQSYFAQENLPKAAEHLVNALRDADKELNPQQVDIGGYERLVESLGEREDDYLAELVKALAFFLDDTGWKPKLLDALQNYAAQQKISYVPDLLELMIEGGRPELASVMQRIDQYINDNMLLMATDEIHYAIEKSPDYLPVHSRLADVLIREARTQDAAVKINLIANTYLLRGNDDKAADLFAQVIDLWPADTGARQRVIDMLRSQGRVSEAIGHYAEMADLYYRLMADPDKAIEVNNEALEYAQQENAEPHVVIPLLRSLADIESQRLNWRKALTLYSRIIEHEPTDSEAAMAIVDLRFQLGDTSEAISALDAFMRVCIKQGNVTLVTSTLEEQVRRRPEEIPLRQRLAEVYRQQERQQEAITQMDALGELLLDAGQLDEAVNTIRKIVAMNPPDVEGYQQLLQELESGGGRREIP